MVDQWFLPIKDPLESVTNVVFVAGLSFREVTEKQVIWYLDYRKRFEDGD